MNATSEPGRFGKVPVYWAVDGVPVAALPTPEGGVSVMAFDVPEGRRVSLNLPCEEGVEISEDYFEVLKIICRTSHNSRAPRVR